MDQKLFNGLPFNGLDFYGVNKSNIGVGTYGQIYKYKNAKTGVRVAVKEYSMNYNGTPFDAIIEISILTKIDNPNIIKIIDVVWSQDQINLVMEYIPLTLSAFVTNNKNISQYITKKYIYDILSGLQYLNQHNIWHSDVSVNNILIKNDHAILCDFGISKINMTRPYNNRCGKDAEVLWSRPPEILLGSPTYNSNIDVYATGMIMARMILGKYLITGTDEQKVLLKISETLGGLDEKSWPGISSLPNYRETFITLKEPGYNYIFSRYIKKYVLGIKLLRGMISPNPDKRLSIDQCLNDIWFQDLNVDRSKKEPIPEKEPISEIEPNPENPMSSYLPTLYGWLLEVMEETEISFDSYFHALVLIERYIDIVEFNRTKLQLVGITSLYISSKMHDSEDIHITDVEYLCASTYSIDEIKSMEKDILTKVGFQLVFPTIKTQISKFIDGIHPKIVNDCLTLCAALSTTIKPDIKLCLDLVKKYNGYEIDNRQGDDKMYEILSKLNSINIKKRSINIIKYSYNEGKNIKEIPLDKYISIPEYITDLRSHFTPDQLNLLCDYFDLKWDGFKYHPVVYDIQPCCPPYIKIDKEVAVLTNLTDAMLSLLNF